MDPALLLARAADEYWAALVRPDEEAAYSAVQQLIVSGLPVDVALTEVVARGQQWIGEHWASADWTVGQEHAATAVSESVLLRLIAELPPVDRSLPRVLVACAERESHSLPALVVAASLRSWGWPAEYVGSLTSEALTQRISDLQPVAVLISASLTSSLTRLARQVAAITESGVPVIVGGSALDPDGDRAERLGASAYAGNPAAARRVLEAMPSVVQREGAPTEQEAYRLERQADDLARRAVEATLRQVGSPAGAVSPDHWSVVLATFTPHLVATIAGGVLLADPTVPEAARSWLDQVLVRRSAPDGVTDVLWAELRDSLRDYPTARALIS
jgi:methanogenic corrinoid protein MtbC1